MRAVFLCKKSTKKLIKTEWLKSLTNDPETDKILMKNTLSTYGLDEIFDIDELICESMAEYINGRPRSFAKQVVEILLKE